MRLDFRIASVAVNRGSAAENETSVAALQHSSADVGFAGIERDRFPGYAGFVEGGRDAVRSPGFLGTGFQNQADLHGDDWHPQRVNAG